LSLVKSARIDPSTISVNLPESFCQGEHPVANQRRSGSSLARSPVDLLARESLEPPPLELGGVLSRELARPCFYRDQQRLRQRRLDPIEIDCSLGLSTELRDVVALSAKQCGDLYRSFPLALASAAVPDHRRAGRSG
jgi:hypothetical protein